MHIKSPCDECIHLDKCLKCDEKYNNCEYGNKKLIDELKQNNEKLKDIVLSILAFPIPKDDEKGIEYYRKKMEYL
jgi:hypothetical protein